MGHVSTCCDQFILRKINTHLHFLSYPNIDIVPIVEILPFGRQGHVYPTRLIPGLLVNMWCREPGHQQPCYWPNYPATFRLNTLRPRQNGRHFADDIFLIENVWISIKIALKFVPKGPINNIPALLQIMAWRRPGDKPLSEAMMVNLPTHICVSRPQWVNIGW